MRNLTVTDVREHPGDSAFLIDDGKTAILYDSGFGFTGFAVAERIKNVLGERKLDFIFLTHSHYDHALGSAYVLEYWPEAKVVAGAYAAEIFKKPTAKKVMRELDRKFALKCGVCDYEDLADNLRVDIPLEDGDTIRAGEMKFTAVSLPGHTRCSVGFYLEENGLLLGNETIGVYDGEGGAVPSYLVGYEMTLDSIKKVKELKIKNILTPHFGLLDEKQTEKYLNSAEKNAIETAESIAGILKGGGTTDEAIDFFKQKYYHGYIKMIYPTDAMELNTGIMVKLIEKELLR